MPGTFKSEHPFENRQKEAQRITSKYEDRIPVIAEPHKRTNLPVIDKKKYLVPSDLTVAQFQYVIRKRIKLTPEQALYVFVETRDGSKVTHILPPTSQTMLAVYNEHKDEDGFLYMTYSGDNAFGCLGH